MFRELSVAWGKMTLPISGGVTPKSELADHWNQGVQRVSSSCACVNARRARAAHRLGKLRSASARFSSSVYWWARMVGRASTASSPGAGDAPAGSAARAGARTPPSGDGAQAKGGGLHVRIITAGAPYTAGPREARLCRYSSSLCRFRRRRKLERSEERRVGKECRSRWSPYH